MCENFLFRRFEQSVKISYIEGLTFNRLEPSEGGIAHGSLRNVSSKQSFPRADIFKLLKSPDLEIETDLNVEYWDIKTKGLADKTNDFTDVVNSKIVKHTFFISCKIILKLLFIYLSLMCGKEAITSILLMA
jgi:hypothetical protein